MAISEVREQFVNQAATIGAGRVEAALEWLWTGAKPGPSEALLASGLAEGRCPDQGLSGVGPAIRMGVVVVQVGLQPGDEVRGRSEVASFEPATRQSAEPEFDLVEPRTVYREPWRRSRHRGC